MSKSNKPELAMKLVQRRFQPVVFCALNDGTAQAAARATLFLLFNLEFHGLDEKFVAHLNGDIVVPGFDLRHLHRDLIVALIDDRGFVIILVVG